MTITIEAPALAAAINNLATALSGSRLPVVTGTAFTGTPSASLPPPAEMPKRGRGRPAAAPPETAQATAVPETPSTEPPDYDSILTQCRQMSVRLMDIDMKEKTSTNKDRLKALWQEIHPEGNGKLSGLPQEKLPEALEKLTAIMPS